MDLNKFKQEILGLDGSPLKDIVERVQGCLGIINGKEDMRLEGHGVPANGYSMVGMYRLEQIEKALEKCEEEGIPGDFIECGVWRGGVCMFAAAFYKTHGINRKVYVADSFQGVPAPEDPKDIGMQLHLQDHLKVSREQVEANFDKYGLLSDNIVFVEGWFKDTIPHLENNWSICRLDGDLYQSTKVCLDRLYPQLNEGGYMVIDDYGCIDRARLAVTDFVEENRLNVDLQKIDWTGVFWRKTATT